MSAITVGSKDIAIGSAQLGDNIIAEANQTSASIDIWGHGDWDFPFGSWKIGNKMSVDFGWNADEKIGMKPSRTIGSPCPQITRNKMRNCDISDSVISFLLWYGTMKSEG